MQPCLCTILAAAMAIAPAPRDPAISFRQLEARMQEHVEQRRFETLAREAEAAYGRRDLSPEQRRVMAFFAVQGLHGMWEVARQPAGLCQARNLLRRVERELGFANDRNVADRLRRATETALQETGLRNPCGSARSTPGAKLPLAAAPAPAQPPPAAAVPQDMDPEEGVPPLLASATPARSTAQDAAPAAVTPPPESAPAIPAPDRRRSPLPSGRIAAGSLLIVAGTVGWVGVAMLLREANEVDDQVIALGKEVLDGGMGPSPAHLARLRQYNEQHEGLTAGAAVVGTAAGLATLSGVLLLAIRPRASRLAARPWGSPWSAGVTLAGSF